MPTDLSYEFIRRIVKFSAKVGYRLGVEGQENLTEHINGLGDGAIFAANHESVIDAFLMGLIVPTEIPRVQFLGKQSALWRNRFWGSMMDYFGVIPVQRKGKGNEEAIRKGLEVLQRRQALGIFPEGHIRYSRKSLEGKVGVARFAFETDSPVVPVGIVGTDGVLPFGGNWPSAGKKVTLTIGEPIYLSYDYDKSDIFSISALRSATDLIMHNIRILSEGYGINPVDAPKLKTMDGIHTLLVPHRRLRHLPKKKGNIRSVDTKGASEYFTDWMSSITDEWKRKPDEEEDKIPSDNTPEDEFLDWLNEQI
ncbi:MAG: lysophospholipid acyltransferase family protein [Candidatus Hodarchaeales archaeon]|jgi:1-acyl-sn-glycerol-3-phosphate acyltransferase